MCVSMYMHIFMNTVYAYNIFNQHICRYLCTPIYILGLYNSSFLILIIHYANRNCFYITKVKSFVIVVYLYGALVFLKVFSLSLWGTINIF